MSATAHASTSRVARLALGARLAMVAATAATVVLTTRTMGISGQGDLALLQFGLLLVTGLAGYVAGGAVVYVRKFVPAKRIVPLALGGIAGATVLGAGLGWWTGWVPEHWVDEACLLGGLQALVVFLSQLVLADGQVTRFHFSQALQVVLHALGWAVAVGSGHGDLSWFVAALAASLGVTAAVLLGSLRGRWDVSPEGASTPPSSPVSPTRLMLVKGAEGQTGSLLQLLTNRLNLSQLERFVSLDASGLYALGYYALEAVWMVGRAWSPAVHARSAAEADAGRRRAHTLWHVRRVVALSAAASVLAAMLPDALWVAIFDVAGVQAMLRSLGVAMVAGSVATLLSHHLSGIGLHRWNAVTSGLGLLVLWTCSAWWIPGCTDVDGAVMAGWALSASAAVQCAGLAWVFGRSRE